MQLRTIYSPRKLVDHLIGIFPAFEREWDQGEAFGYSGDYTYHVVFQTFAPESARLLKAATPDQLREFCSLLNFAVETGSDLENAVCTCLLEHASQIGIRNIIKPYLSREAKDELR